MNSTTKEVAPTASDKSFTQVLHGISPRLDGLLMGKSQIKNSLLWMEVYTNSLVDF
jgi:hypothetical protein